MRGGRRNEHRGAAPRASRLLRPCEAGLIARLASDEAPRGHGGVVRMVHHPSPQPPPEPTWRTTAEAAVGRGGGRGGGSDGARNDRRHPSLATTRGGRTRAGVCACAARRAGERRTRCWPLRLHGAKRFQPDSKVFTVTVVVRPPKLLRRRTKKRGRHVCVLGVLFVCDAWQVRVCVRVCVFVAATARGRSYQAPCIHAPAFYASPNVGRKDEGGIRRGFAFCAGMMESTRMYIADIAETRIWRSLRTLRHSVSRVQLPQQAIAEGIPTDGATLLRPR